MTHTPGPWTFRGPTKAGPWRGGFYIAIDVGASALGYATKLEDARLMSAAPNMLKALHGARAFFEQHMDTLFGIGHDIPMADGASMTIAELDSAIAEAEGTLALTSPQTGDAS